MQQGGNVWEWTESWQYGVIGSRALRGGSWQYTEYGLNAVNEDPGGINDKSYLYGGRICMAVDSVGFKKTSIPFCDKLYKQIALIPRKHFIYMVLFGICLMIILFGVSIYSIYRWRSYRK